MLGWRVARLAIRERADVLTRGSQASSGYWDIVQDALADLASSHERIAKLETNVEVCLAAQEDKGKDKAGTKGPIAPSGNGKGRPRSPRGAEAAEL